MGDEQKNAGFRSSARHAWLNGRVILIGAVIFMVGVLAWAIYRATRPLEDHPDKDSSQ